MNYSHNYVKKVVMAVFRLLITKIFLIFASIKELRYSLESDRYGEK